MGSNHTKSNRAENAFPDDIQVTGNPTVDTIRSVWGEIIKSPEKQVDAGVKIYKRLFSKHPQYRNLFSEDLSLVVKRLTMMVSTVVDGLDDLIELEKRIHVLGKRHSKYNVPSEAFGHFVEAILWGMGDSIGEEFDEHTKDCFDRMFQWASEVMISAAKRRRSKKKRKYNVNNFPALESFDEFLEHPVCVEYFHLYLTSNYSEESIMFYIDIIKFKNTEIAIGEIEQAMKTLAQDLYDKYIHAAGPNQINIPYSIVDEIQKAMETPTAGIFDNCVKEIKSLLHKGKWLPFLESESCQALCACLAGDIQIFTDRNEALACLTNAR